MTTRLKAHGTITYSVTTEESAEHGDHAEHGFWMPGGWEDAVEDANGRHADVVEASRVGEYDLSLRDAVRHAIDLGAVNEIQVCGSRVTAYSYDPPCDRAFIEDGESRLYAVHIEATTPLRARLVASALRG